VTDSTLRFGDRVEDYARYRPAYPREAIVAVLGGSPAPRVADLGAGTGISAVLLADAGAEVFAVEPNAGMRRAIPQRERVHPVNGTAESTGLPEASVDLITAFQAYHWFDPARVFAEADRIARRPARFAAVWNERDERDPFTRRYGEIIRPYMLDDTEHRRQNTGVAEHIERFGWGPPRLLEFRHDVPMTLDAYLGRARSSSYLPNEGDAYEALAEELRAHFASAQHDGVVRFAYVTAVHLGERA
jgi:SAM-dependent methyltransferase